MCSLTGNIITLFTHPNNYPSQPKSMRPFVGFWLGIFAIHKTWTSLAFWWRIDDKTGTLAYPVWRIVWVVQTQLFAENSNVVEKFHPKSWKVHIPGDFCSKSRKIRKVEKFEKFENSRSRKVQIPGDFCSKNAKSRKVHMPGDFCLKSRKNEKFESRKLFDFWLFAKSFAIFALCDYRREERLAFWRIWAAERPKRTTRGRARSTAQQTKLARSVLEDLGCWAAKRTTRGRAMSTAKQTNMARSVLEDLGRWAAKTEHQRESKEHSQADQAGEVRFGGFGLLSSQNGPPEGEQGAQPSWPSWRGPFGGFGLLSGQNGPPGRERDRDPPPALVWWGYRACVRTGTWTLSSHPTPPPTRPKRTTRERARSTAKLTKLARSVLEDLGCWAAKTDHQGEKGTETHRQLSCDEVAVPVCAQEHGRSHPTPPHPHPPHPTTPPTLKPDMVSQMRGKWCRRWGKIRGVLVSQMRGIWCHRWGADPGQANDLRPWISGPVTGHGTKVNPLASVPLVRGVDVAPWSQLGQRIIWNSLPKAPFPTFLLHFFPKGDHFESDRDPRGLFAM